MMSSTSIVCVITLAALALAACGPQQGTGPAFRSFADDARGACFNERQELERQGDRFGESFDQRQSAAGQTGSVVARYLSVLLSGERSFLEVLGIVNDDLERENRWIGWTVDAFDNLTACRRANTLAINGDLRAGRIDRQTAETRIEAVRTAYREDIARYRQYADQVALNTTRFADLYRDIAVDNDQPTDRIDAVLNTSKSEQSDPNPPKTEQVAPKPRRATATRPGRLKIEAPAPTARASIGELEAELLTNVRKRDELIERIDAAETEVTGFDLAISPARPRHAKA